MAKRKTAIEKGRKKTASVQRMPITTNDIMKGGVKRPRVSTGKIDTTKALLAKKQQHITTGAGGFGFRQRSAGMMLQNAPLSTYNQTGYLSAYRTSYADGLNQTSGTADIPPYFVMMNQQNGGILYWPVTLKEKYSWYRYWARCCYTKTYDAKVLMADGIQKDIEDVQIGDEIITGKGTIRKVKDKFERRCVEDKAVTLKVWCLQTPLQTTHHHPYYVLRQSQIGYDDGRKYYSGINFKPEWIHAENIQPGDYVLMAPAALAVESSITPEQARFLGYYAAEGSIIWGDRCIDTKERKGWKWNQEKIKVPRGVAFTIHINEKDTIGKSISNMAKELFGIEANFCHERGNSVEIMLHSREVGEFCFYHVGVYSEKKKLSKELVWSSNESRKQFLIGYMEGDGHQYKDDKNRGKIVIGTSSTDLASQVRFIAISCGIMCRYASYDRTKNSGFESKTKQIHITIPAWSANELISSEETKWDTTSTKNDKHCAFFINGYAAFKVKEVTFTEEDDTVYNIEVDAEGDEKSYICNGMVTHNTDAYVGRALELLTDLPMARISLNMPKLEKVSKKKKQQIYDFYRYMVDRIDLFARLQEMLWEHNMIGNCFPAGHRVHTPKGMLPIEQIRTGDLVLTHNGCYKLVTNTMRRNVAERLVEIQLDRLRAIKLTPTEEHPFLVLRNDKEVFIKAKDIRIGDYLSLVRRRDTKDIQMIDVMSELKSSGVLDGKYKNIEISKDGEICAEYETRTGSTDRSVVVKEKLMDWLSSINEPVVADCNEVAALVGVSSPTQLRTAAYSLRRKGVIKTQRTSKGRKGGSSIKWFACEDRHVSRDWYVREWKQKFRLSKCKIKIDNQFMYLLGYWFGDGWLWHCDHDKAHSYLAFDICVDKNSKTMQRVRSAMDSVFGDLYEEPEKGSFCKDDLKHFIFRDPMFCEWWAMNFGDSSKNKKIPDWIERLPKEKLIYLLQGLIDSDGCVTKSKKNVYATISMSSEDVMQSAFRIGLSCGIPFCLYEIQPKESVLPNGKKVFSKTNWKLQIAEPSKVALLIDGCVKGIDVPDMDGVVPPNYKEKNGEFYYRVSFIDNPFYEGYVYNLSVDDDQTYCVENVNTHNCFSFIEWNDKLGMWDKIVILPPEEVDIFQYPFSEIARVEYRPERLIQLIQNYYNEQGYSDICSDNSIYGEIVKHIPKEINDMVRKQGCIVMDTDPSTGSFVYHMGRRRSPYLDLGASVLERILVPMLQKEHYRYTQLSLASRNMTPKNKVQAPNLTNDQLDDLRAQLDLSYLDPDYSIVTNYDWEWEQIGAEGRLLDLSSEYDNIENQVFAALGVTRELLTGEGTFSGNKITVEILNTMFLIARESLQRFVEKYLFEPVAEKKGWYEEDANGIKQYWYPKLGFNRLTIRDNQEVFDSLFQLYQKGSLPIDIIYELFNLNTEAIHDQIYDDLFTVKDPTFNRAVEGMNDAVGAQLGERSNLVERTAKYLKLELKPAEGEEGTEGGFGGGFGEESTETEENQDQIAEEVAEELPEDATDEEIDEAIDKKMNEGEEESAEEESKNETPAKEEVEKEEEEVAFGD